jgi:hypothetical protein
MKLSDAASAALLRFYQTTTIRHRLSNNRFWREADIRQKPKGGVAFPCRAGCRAFALCLFGCLQSQPFSRD